ncbi:hypothetical protein D0Z07_1277 [Hyphodiscus hymeniophilus]|uniref:Aminoglycoside phosphotransferase domain-containing protein n=1 Tax=Hyphodiscus hymeniophilus TaxID=353542 RepID=A0A9P6VPN5_9HELO|nr:hypothetical protein D0Z07_1277 [Hyphodiscus hymeniophilus]
MDDKTSILDTAIDDFFVRASLVTQNRIDCYAFIEELYPGEPISPAPCQGYCSLTLFVGDTVVVQFRPSIYKLDLQVAQAAREVYGTFAPDTSYLGTLPSGLLAYSMNRMDGISLKDLRSANMTAVQSAEHRRRLCKDFACFLAKAWHKNNPNIPLGLIGLSLVSRLKALVANLPPRFQSTARHVLRQLHRIETLPWVLAHGDILAANILVHPSTCNLLGFVDWAEAERLPFGVCFYGLEEILGEMTPSGFRYYPDSRDLRDLFWEELKIQIPELQQSQMLQAVKLARDLGVLLWHGIAFDNGAIDRVVEEFKDVEEIQRLDAFLENQPDQEQDVVRDPTSKLPPNIFSTKASTSRAPFPRSSQRQHIPAQ